MGCPACQQENPAGAKFCLECGARLVQAAPAGEAAPLSQSWGGGRYQLERLLGEGAAAHVQGLRLTPERVLELKGIAEPQRVRSVEYD